MREDLEAKSTTRAVAPPTPRNDPHAAEGLDELAWILDGNPVAASVDWIAALNAARAEH